MGPGTFSKNQPNPVPDLHTFPERTPGKMYFNDVIMCQECDTLNLMTVHARHLQQKDCSQMDFQDHFVAIIVGNISLTIFRKINQ